MSNSGERTNFDSAKQENSIASIVNGHRLTHQRCGKDAEKIRFQETSSSTIPTTNGTGDKGTDGSSDGEDGHSGAPE